MGIFDSFRNAVPGGDISKPIMIAIGALLAAKVFGHHGQGAAAPAPQGAPPMPPEPHQEDGGLAGGLGGLLDKFKQNGLGGLVSSWVGHGPNQPVTPGQVESGLGSDILDQLAAKTGMSRDQLTQELSKVLPGIVDKMTPQGQIPQGH